MLRANENMRSKVSSNQKKRISTSKLLRGDGLFRGTLISFTLLLFTGACRVEPEQPSHGQDVKIVMPPVGEATIAEKTLEKSIRETAEQGNSKAQYDLGTMYLKGVGVPQDMYKAYVWYTLAAIGDPTFANIRDDARNNLASDAVLKAQREAFKLHEMISSR